MGHRDTRHLAPSFAPRGTGDFDVVVVGAGLHGCLLALALRHHRPDARICLVERAEQIGGAHTWCCHTDGLGEQTRAWVEPLFAHRWTGYDVCFPTLARRLDLGYAAMTSAHLRAVVLAQLAVPGCAVKTGQAAEIVGPGQVQIDGGQSLTAPLVIEARGPQRWNAPAGCGWQVFLGQEVQLAGPHGLSRPMLMDATVAQDGGFRFVYALPFGPDRVLVEDTLFADAPTLHAEDLRAGVLRWMTARGWRVLAVLREERGVLPMPWQRAAPVASHADVVAGVQGGWFHPASGYSLPVALRLAEAVAVAASGAEVQASVARLRAELAPQQAFARGLNRALFRHLDPADRVHTLAGFHRRPAATVRRFHDLAMSLGDRIRVFTPPAPPGIRLWPRTIEQEVLA